MYFLPQFQDQGHASLRIWHDLASLLVGSTHIYTQFDAQNAGNRASRFQNFLEEGMPTDPRTKRGLVAPCPYRHLLFLNSLPTSNFIETPA